METILFISTEDACGVSMEDESKRANIKVRQHNWNNDQIVCLEMTEEWTKIEDKFYRLLNHNSKQCQNYIQCGKSLSCDCMHVWQITHRLLAIERIY